MLRDRTFLGFIPARKGSKRLPDKNMKILGDSPLFTWVYKAAVDSKIFDKIVISTDDERIMEYCDKFGIKYDRRPSSLCTDTATIPDAIQEYLKRTGEQYDYVQILEPTVPLLRHDTIKGAANLMCDWECDVLISLIPSRVPSGVCKPIPEHFANKYSLCGWMPDEIRNVQSQYLQTTYQLNGYIYIIRYDIAYNNRDWWDSDIRPYLMEHDDCIDIDDKYDFRMAELRLQERLENED